MHDQSAGELFLRVLCLVVAAVVAARLSRITARREGFMDLVPLWLYAGPAAAWIGAFVGSGSGRLIFLLSAWLPWPALIIPVGLLTAASAGALTASLWVPQSMIADCTITARRMAACVFAKFGALIAVAAAILSMLLGVCQFYILRLLG